MEKPLTSAKDPRLMRAFGQLAFIVNRHLMDHMRRMSSELDMDFEAAFIWGILAHMNMARLFHPGKHPIDVLNEVGRKGTSLEPVRLADVVQVTGLPRETVRRKLEQLAKLGKADRTNEGLWLMNQNGVDENTIEFTKETIMRFLKTAEDMRSLLRQVDSY